MCGAIAGKSKPTKLKGRQELYTDVVLRLKKKDQINKRPLGAALSLMVRNLT